MYANENFFDIYSKPALRSWGLQDLLALLYICYTLIGNTTDKFLYVGLGLLAVWFFFALLANPQALEMSFKNSQVGCVIFFAFYILINGFSVAGWLFTIKQVLAAIMQFSYIIIFGYYLQPSQSAKLKTIFKILFFVFLCVEIRTLLFYAQNEGAARDLARDQEIYGQLYGVGGYTFAYASALFAIIALNLILDKRIAGNSKKILWISVFVLSTFVIIMTESTITLIAYIIGVFVCIFFRNYNKKLDVNNPRLAAAIKVLFIAVLILLFIPFLKYLGEFLIDFSSKFPKDLGGRIKQLGEAIIGDNDDGYALNRIKIPWESFKTFLQNPIIGISYKHGNGYLNKIKFGAGNHCEWVDALTNYGLIGGIPFLAIYFIQIKKIIKVSVGLSIAWVVCLIIMGLFNPFRSFQSHIVIFFMIPALAFLLSQEETGKI